MASVRPNWIHPLVTISVKSKAVDSELEYFNFISNAFHFVCYFLIFFLKFKFSFHFFFSFSELFRIRSNSVWLSCIMPNCCTPTAAIQDGPSVSQCQMPFSSTFYSTISTKKHSIMKESKVERPNKKL